KYPCEQADGKRKSDREDRETQDGEHSTVLRGESGNAGRSIFLPLEDHDLEGRRIGESSTQQAVIQCMSGLVGGERPEQRTAEEIQIADRVQELVPYELVREA